MKLPLAAKCFSLAICFSVLSSSNHLHAGTIFESRDDDNPSLNGFTQGSCCKPVVTQPLANDLGRAAWRIWPSFASQEGQLGYNSPVFNAAQQSDIAANGFTLTMEARALQNLAPANSATTPNITTIAGSTYNGRRYDIGLGIDANGDTVAIVGTGIQVAGNGGPIRLFGPRFIVPGNAYHTYQLLYNPTSNNADFYIDGVLQSQGYTGRPNSSGPGLNWSNFSGGDSRFSLTQLASGSTVVPEPGSFFLLAQAGIILVCRRRTH